MGIEEDEECDQHVTQRLGKKLRKEQVCCVVRHLSCDVSCALQGRRTGEAHTSYDATVEKHQKTW